MGGAQQLALDLPAAMVSAHDGASLTARDVAAWVPRRLSADAEIIPEIGTLVGRARDLDRNSGIAESGISTIIDNVLGSGLRVSPRPDYQALGRTKAWADGWAREVRALWESYYWTTACDATDKLTGDQITAQIARAVMVNGDAVSLPLWIPDRGDGWATKMQTVESDRLCNPFGQSERLAFRGGIEFDPYGAPIAYHIRRTHPGDSVSISSDDCGFGQWERIPRRAPHGRLRVLHVYDAKRSGQSRGKPMLTSVLPAFKNANRYLQAELQAAVVNALVAAVITTPLEADDIVELFSKDRDALLKARREHAVRLESGMLATLFPGDQLTSFTPSRPATAFDAFMLHLERHIGLGFDLPYELLMKDFSRLNYVTARAMLAEAWRSFMRRRDWLTTTWIEPWFRLWFEEAVNARKIDAPDFYAKAHAWSRVRVIGPGRGTLDPVKEAQAGQLRVDAGFSTLEDECAETGRDWVEVAEQRAAEIARYRELGLPDHSAIRAANPIQSSPDGGRGEPSDASDTPADRGDGDGGDQPNKPARPAQTKGR